MCVCVLHCLKKYLCVSVFPLFSFKIFLLLWKNIQRLGCFSEWLALLLLFRLRVLQVKNSGSGQLPGFSTKCISKFFFWLGGTKYIILFFLISEIFPFSEKISTPKKVVLFGLPPGICLTDCTELPRVNHWKWMSWRSCP